jgi:hypothetical protein
MTTPRLSEGLWTPNLQMYDAGDISSTQVSFPGARDVAKDLLKNEQQTPMIVRSFCCTYNWVTSRRYTTDPLLFDVIVRSTRKGEYRLSPNTNAFAPPTNIATGLYGSTAVAAMPYVFKLATPCRLGVGESILLEVGNAEGEEVFSFAVTTAAKTTGYSVKCRGVNSGRIVHFGKKETIALGSTSKITGVHQNFYDEPLDILSLTIFTGSATTDRPLFLMEVNGRRWSRSERPMWLYCEPFKYSRVSFARLPEGGLVFMPEDQFEIIVRNPQYSDGGGYVNIYLVLGVEAYQQVA